MTLDETIQYCKKKAKELSDKAHKEWGYGMTEEEAYDCNQHALGYDKVARWLKELKDLKDVAVFDTDNDDCISSVSIEWAVDILSERTKIICPGCHFYRYYSNSDGRDTHSIILPKHCENCGRKMGNGGKKV